MATRRKRERRRRYNKTRGGYRKRITRRGGGYGKPSCPFVGERWNAIGPPANVYAEKPWYPSNNSNFYAYSKYGIRPGGIIPYPGSIPYHNVKGGKKKRKTKKRKNLGLKGGGITLSDIVPDFLLNIWRPIETGIINKAPIKGKQWQGKPKNISQLPTIQPNLQKNYESNINSNNILDVKQIYKNAVTKVNDLKTSAKAAIISTTPKTSTTPTISSSSTTSTTPTISSSSTASTTPTISSLSTASTNPSLSQSKGSGIMTSSEADLLVPPINNKMVQNGGASVSYPSEHLEYGLHDLLSNTDQPSSYNLYVPLHPHGYNKQPLFDANHKYSRNNSNMNNSIVTSRQRYN